VHKIPLFILDDKNDILSRRLDSCAIAVDGIVPGSFHLYVIVRTVGLRSALDLSGVKCDIFEDA
jgi:hypothetical protein